MPAHRLNDFDKLLVERAQQLLWAAIRADLVKPAQLVSLAKVLNAYARLPLPTDAGFVSISLTGPRHRHGEVETWFWWEVTVDGELVVLECGGHFHQPSTGGDSFTSMRWHSEPGSGTEFEDNRGELKIVPNMESFATGVPILLDSPGDYEIAVDDRGNPWLDEELESQNSDEEEPIDAGTAAQAWTIVPCDEFERRLAETVVPDEVNAREPQFTYGVDECGSCNCDLLQRGLAIDGKMKGQILWGNFCVPCFLRECEGIGWGRGQLYAKQPSGEWRQVAGFEL